MTDTIADDALAVAFSWWYLVRAISGLAPSLHYLHRSHTPPIYHRDVKSANIVLSRRCVCDAGRKELVALCLRAACATRDATAVSERTIPNLVKQTALTVTWNSNHFTTRADSRGGRSGISALAGPNAFSTHAGALPDDHPSS